MKQLLLILCLGILGNASAEIVGDLYFGPRLQSTKFDSTLNDNQSKYTFEFFPLDGSQRVMLYSIDGIEGRIEMNGNSIEILTIPGKHIFQFYYSDMYTEVYSDSLEIKNQFHSVYDVQMSYNFGNMQIEVDKPVIYLYPEKEMDVEVKVNVKGTDAFFYPKYVDSWNFSATPNGDLSFGENTYNYLFWEATQQRMMTTVERHTGFLVSQAEVVSFLEEKLTLAGLNSKEQADFITFWGPRLAANKLNFVRFEFNETCNRYAELNIEPQPDEVYRIYMTWMPLEAEIHIEEQEIERFSREGFSVLEWGGMEIQDAVSGNVNKKLNSKAVK